MKIEMGESLLYSWLRHVKECHLVQMNWKISPHWELQNRDEIMNLLEYSSDIFLKELNSSIYKNTSVDQFLKQAEVDVLGISLNSEDSHVYAVDVAFHGAGLNYGSKEETVTRVVKKCMRTAMCIYGFLGYREGEIIFASPKVNNAVVNGLLPFIELSNKILREVNLGFHVRVLVNDDFEKKILSPILIASQGVADTSELFLRSYQMYKMFAPNSYAIDQNSYRYSGIKKQGRDDTQSTTVPYASDSGLAEMKVGRLANTVLRSMLESKLATDDEIAKMQTTSYSKEVFHLNFSLLKAINEHYDRVRYYKKPLRVKGNEYVLCSQWYETSANNDKPYLLSWIASHQI